MTDRDALLPCPSCGGDALGHEYEWSPMICHVQCVDCDLYITGDTKEEAAEKWNKRPALTQSAEAKDKT